MRFVKSDNVKLDADDSVARNQIDEAIKERFPMAMEFLQGGEWNDHPQLKLELQMIIPFLASNWVAARHDLIFSHEEWSVIFDCLRYAASEIGYLPKTKRLETIRDQAKKISGKMLAANIPHSGPSSCNVKDLQYEDLPIYPGDWLTMLQCIQYTAVHVSLEDPDVCMRDLRRRIEEVGERVAYRVIHHEHYYATRCGASKFKASEQVENILVMPWRRQEELRGRGMKAVGSEKSDHPQYVKLEEREWRDPKEEFETRPGYPEGEDPTYPKDMDLTKTRVLPGIQIKKIMEDTNKKIQEEEEGESL